MKLFTRVMFAGALTIATAQGAFASGMIYLDVAGQYAGTAAVNSAIDHQRKRLEEQKSRRANQHQQQAKQALTKRQAACAARYRSYNPRTDTYLVRAGVTAKCPL